MGSETEGCRFARSWNQLQWRASRSQPEQISSARWVPRSPPRAAGGGCSLLCPSLLSSPRSLRPAGRQADPGKCSLGVQGLQGRDAAVHLLQQPLTLAQEQPTHGPNPHPPSQPKNTPLGADLWLLCPVEPAGQELWVVKGQWQYFAKDDFTELSSTHRAHCSAGYTTEGFTELVPDAFSFSAPCFKCWRSVSSHTPRLLHNSCVVSKAIKTVKSIWCDWRWTLGD